MAMTYEIQTDGDISIVRLTGKLDVGSAAEFLHLSRDLSQYAMVTMDLRAMDLMDVSAVQIVLALQCVHGTTVQLQLDAACPAVPWLERSGLLDKLGVAPSSSSDTANTTAEVAAGVHLMQLLIAQLIAVEKDVDTSVTEVRRICFPA